MEEVLSTFGSLYKGVRRYLNRPLARALAPYVTANTVTVVRALAGAPLVLALLFFDLKIAAFCMYVIAGYLDSFDGSLATVRRDMGYQDDEALGAFLDAFCDKVFMLAILAGLIPLTILEPKFLATGFLTVLLIVLTVETILGAIRVQDYQHEKSVGDHKRLLKASLTGKLKFTLEIIGAGGLVLSSPALNHWAAYVGLACLALSLPFGLRSLTEKLKARKPTT